MAWFEYHLFVCTNRRKDGERCCAGLGAAEARAYLKEQCKKLGIHGKGKTRINSAGCMDRCQEGPVLVIYPEGTWYTWVDKEDLDEIIACHLLRGEVVERLRIPG